MRDTERWGEQPDGRDAETWRLRRRAWLAAGALGTLAAGLGYAAGRHGRGADAAMALVPVVAAAGASGDGGAGAGAGAGGARGRDAGELVGALGVDGRVAPGFGSGSGRGSRDGAGSEFGGGYGSGAGADAGAGVAYGSGPGAGAEAGFGSGAGAEAGVGAGAKAGVGAVYGSRSGAGAGSGSRSGFGSRAGGRFGLGSVRAGDGGALAPLRPSHFAAAGGGEFCLQVSAFRTRPEAQAYTAALQRRGFTPFVQAGGTARGGTWYRVRVGRFASEAAAQDVKARLAQADIPAWVVRAR